MFNKFSQHFTEKSALKVLFLCASVYVLLYFTLCTFKYYGFAYDDFDLAIHDQIVWNIIHGRIFNSILGIDFLGNHVHFISFLVAPLYWFIPHPLFLLFLQTVSLAAGAYPLYALARLYLGYQISLVICVVYLLYPGLGYTNLFEFHPTCFATFFLLYTAYYFYKEDFTLFNVFMILSLICQENIALIFIMWGIYACILKRKLKWVLWPTCLGLVYFFSCLYVILPAFNKDTFNFFNIYGPLGGSLGQIAHHFFLHPVKVMSILFQPHKRLFFAQLFVSLYFIPVLSPLSLLPVFLIFIQHFLSFRPGEASLYYHYTAELIPFIFVAYVLGIKKITDFFPKFRYLGAFLLLVALIVNHVLGPHFHLIQEWKKLTSDRSAAQNENLIKQIPEDASVVATFHFLPHLSRRQDLYSFHYVYSGFNTLFTKPYHLPDNVQYALIDFTDALTFSSFYKLGNYRNIENFLKHGSLGSLDGHDSIVLFKKGIKDKYPLFDFIDARIVPPHPVSFIVDGRIELYGYDVKIVSDCIHIIFYWKLLRPENKDVNLFIDLIDQNGSIINRRYRPLCYRIWPTQAWQKGQFIEEHQYVSVSPGLMGRLKKLKIGFIDYNTKNSIPTDSKDPLGRIELEIDN